MKSGRVVRQKKWVIEAKLGIVILARLSSRRLPGKALKDLGGKPSLAYVLERCLRVVSREQLILATSDEAEDAALADFGESQGIAVYRGSLENVASRFYQAAESQNWDYACRINGDNIFLDPAVLALMLQKAASAEYLFLSNVHQRSFPKGMSVEIVSLKYYAQCLPQIAASAYYREHVMPLLYEVTPAAQRYDHYNKRFPAAAGQQWALDSPEDWQRAQWILEQMKEAHWHYGLKELLTLHQAYEKAFSR